MSSTSNSQNLLVNVFRPVYTYSAGSGFTPRLVVSNVDILSAGAVQTGSFQFGDANNNLFIGSNAGGGSNNASNVGIGVGAMTNKANSTRTVAIGTNALQGALAAVDTIAVGAETTGGGTSNVILGARSGTIGSNMILLGSGLVTTGDVSGKLYIGASNISNSLIYGDFNNRYVGINTVTPTTNLDVSGDMRVTRWLSAGFSGSYSPQGAIDANGYVYASLGFRAQGGSATNPAFTFIDDSGTGFYQTNLGGFAITAQGNRLVDICGDTMFVYGNLKAFGSVNIGSVDTSSFVFSTGYVRDNAINPNTDLSASGLRTTTIDVSSLLQTSNGIIRVGPPAAPTVDISGSSIRAAQIYATNFVQSPFVHDAASTFDLSGGNLRLNSNIVVSNVLRTPAGAIRVGAITNPLTDISGGNIRTLGTVDLSTGTATRPSLAFVTDTSSGIHSGGTSILAFDTAGLQRMTLSNGNLGIGKATPVVALEVVGDVSATTYNGPGGTAGAPHYTFSDDRTTGVFFPGTNILGLTAGGTERMRISNAAIGIGTTAPTNALDVSGTLRVIGTGGNEITLTNGTINATAGVNISGIPIVSTNGSFSNAATTSNSIGGVTLSNTNIVYSGTITGSTASASNSIGGVTLSNSNAIVGGFLRNALTPSQFDISGGNISNSGTQTSSNFLGTASASNSIGGVTLSNSNAIVGGFLRNALTPSQFDISGGNISNAGTTRSSNFVTTTASSNSIGGTVLSNATVGIGTTTPGYALDVSQANASISTQAVIRNPNAGGQAAIAIMGQGTTDPLLGLRMYHDSATQGLYTSNTVPLTFFTSNTRRMTILSNGNVGLGTTAPQHVLDVSSAGANARIYGGSLLVTSNNSVTAPSGLRMIATSGDSFIQWGSDVTSVGTGTGNLRFTPIFGQTDYLRIQSNGNIGIGTTAPQYALDVSSSASDTAIFRNSTGQAGILISGNATGGSLALFQNSNEQGLYTANTVPFGVWTNNVRRITILSNGDVGIGLTNPGQRLHVAGNIQMGSVANDYRQFSLAGGNTFGYIYGAFNKYGDGIHLGYNFYNTNTTNVIPSPGGETSRVWLGYGIIAMYTGGVNTEPTNLGYYQTANARVGIGYSNPLGKLDICGGLSIYGLPGNGSARPGIATGSTFPDYEIRAHNRGAGDDGFMRLRAGGYLNATSASYIDLTGFNTTAENSRNIVLGTRGVERMRIDPDGNVGIATSSPGARLDVAGTIRGSSNIVAVATTSNWVGTPTSFTDTSLTISYTPKQSGTVRLIVSANAELTVASSGSGTDSVYLEIRNNGDMLTAFNTQFVNNPVDGRGFGNYFSGGRWATVSVTGTSLLNMRIARSSDDTCTVRNGYLSVYELSST